MNEFYCIALTEHMIAGKALLDYTHLFSPNAIKRMAKYYISTLKTNMTKEHVEP